MTTIDLVKNLKVNKIRIKAQQCVNNLNKRFIGIKLYKHHQNTSLCSTCRQYIHFMLVEDKHNTLNWNETKLYYYFDFF